jgi:hypothetical protein
MQFSSAVGFSSELRGDKNIDIFEFVDLSEFLSWPLQR